MKEMFRSFITLMTEIITIWGFVFAFSNFLKQLRMQNLSTNAGRALELCAEAEKVIEDLLNLGRKNEQYRKKAISNLFLIFRDLKYSLEFLGNIVQDQVKQINKLINITNQDDSSEVFKFYKEGKFLEELHELKKILKSIYDEPEKNKWKPWFYFCILFLVTCVLFILINKSNYFAQFSILQTLFVYAAN